MSKPTDIKSWFDYFGLLRNYAEKGFLEVKPQGALPGGGESLVN